MGYYTVYLAVFSPCSSSQGTSCQEGYLLLSDRKSILMAQNLVRSSGQYVVIVNIVLLFKKDRQKNKVTKVKNVNAMNLLQNGQFLWNIILL